MISYELAKKLKDAGFPQYLKLGSIFYLEDRKCCFASDSNGPLHDGLLFPTLSELIEACEEWVKLYGWEDTWGAEDVSGKITTKGSTPEEAVANLWLILNENK